MTKIRKIWPNNKSCLTCVYLANNSRLCAIKILHGTGSFLSCSVCDDWKERNTSEVKI